MKETIIVKTYDEVIQIIDKTFENYVDKHQFLIDDLTSFGIETKIKLRYFYNGIYQAKNRKKRRLRLHSSTIIPKRHFLCTG